MEMSFTQSAEYMIREYGLSMTVGEVIAAVTQMAEDTYLTRVDLKPGASELLLRCKAAGHPMAVGTALDEGLARRLLERLGILDFFRGVYTCETLASPKPTRPSTAGQWSCWAASPGRRRCLKTLPTP